MDRGSLTRQMPVSIEAERALLGSIIRDPECFDKVAGLITAEDFYLDEHKRIYSSLVKMYTQSKTIDEVTLLNALTEDGKKSEAEGIKYISLIVSSVPAVTNVKDYAAIVKDKSKLRKLIGICEEITDESYEEASPVRTIIDSAEQRIFDLSHNNESKDFRHIRDILQNVYQEIETTSESGGAVTGSKTGFSDLDNSWRSSRYG